MRLWLALFTTLCLCAAPAVQAGPWLREKGSVFTSFSLTANSSKDLSTSAYLEYGLNEKMTIGADIGTFTSASAEKSGFATFFMRRALGKNKGSSRWAYELGVGTAWVGDLVLPHVKTGLTWGRGYQWRDKNGWMTVDASMLWELSEGDHVGKVDATLGLNFTKRTSGMVQLYLAHLDNEFFAKVVPSIVITPGKAKFRIQVATEIPVDDMKNTALKVGIWREF